jgi:hypothetical protein
VIVGEVKLYTLKAGLPGRIDTLEQRAIEPEETGICRKAWHQIIQLVGDKTNRLQVNR